MINYSGGKGIAMEEIDFGSAQTSSQTNNDDNLSFDSDEVMESLLQDHSDTEFLLATPSFLPQMPASHPGTMLLNSSSTVQHNSRRMRSCSLSSEGNFGRTPPYPFSRPRTNSIISSLDLNFSGGDFLLLEHTSPDLHHAALLVSSRTIVGCDEDDEDDGDEDEEDEDDSHRQRNAAVQFFEEDSSHDEEDSDQDTSPVEFVVLKSLTSSSSSSSIIPPPPPPPLPKQQSSVKRKQQQPPQQQPSHRRKSTANADSSPKRSQSSASSTGASTEKKKESSQSSSSSNANSNNAPVPVLTMEEEIAFRRSQGILMLGMYSPKARRQRVLKFVEKRDIRVWKKKVKYDVRKNFADSRLRVKGRFVKKDDEDLLREYMELV